MMAGEADIAPSLAQFVPAADQGAPLVGFAAAFNQFGILWALSNDAIARTGVSPDAPIEDKIRAMKGLRSGISRTGSTVNFLTRVLAKSVVLNPDTEYRKSVVSEKRVS